MDFWGLSLHQETSFLSNRDDQSFATWWTSTGNEQAPICLDALKVLLDRISRTALIILEVMFDKIHTIFQFLCNPRNTCVFMCLHLFFNGLCICSVHFAAGFDHMAYYAKQTNSTL